MADGMSSASVCTVLLTTLIFAQLQHVFTAGLPASVRKDVYVTTVNAFAGELAVLPCYVEEVTEVIAGKVTHDERRILWEYAYDSSGEGAKTFFLSKHSEVH